MVPLVKYSLMYSPKVRANYLILGATRPTRIVVITKSTHVFYAEESDSSDDESDAGNSVCSSSTVGVGDTTENAVATISTEIMELDKIGFDETIDVNHSKDM